MNSPTQIKRRRLVVTLIAAGVISTTTGCTTNAFSLASMNPFSSKTSKVDPLQPEKPSITESIAKSAKSTTDRLTGMFRPKGVKAEADPLSLSNTPEKVNPEVFVANGQLWEASGNTDKAMENYTKALQDDAEYGPALTSIARLQYRIGNHAKAAEFFQKAIAKSPEDSGLYNDLGLTLGQLGRHDQASQVLQRALELSPGVSRYANNLAKVRYDAGDADGAYKVLAGNNKPAVAHFNMAYLHYSNGKPALARQQLNLSMQYESQASVDPSVKRAVDRSREMLARIDGGSAPASSPVQPGLPPTQSGSVSTRIASGPRPSTFGQNVGASNAAQTVSPIRQTSQSVAVPTQSSAPAQPGASRAIALPPVQPTSTGVSNSGLVMPKL
ncbi:MAG: tetratricopeptide repeat protein [Planctomycetota bacterium]